MTQMQLFALALAVAVAQGLTVGPNGGFLDKVYTRVAQARPEANWPLSTPKARSEVAWPLAALPPPQPAPPPVLMKRLENVLEARTHKQMKRYVQGLMDYVAVWRNTHKGMSIKALTDTKEVQEILSRIHRSKQEPGFPDNGVIDAADFCEGVEETNPCIELEKKKWIANEMIRQCQAIHDENKLAWGCEIPDDSPAYDRPDWAVPQAVPPIPAVAPLPVPAIALDMRSETARPATAIPGIPVVPIPKVLLSSKKQNSSSPTKGVAPVLIPTVQFKFKK